MLRVHRIDIPGATVPTARAVWQELWPEAFDDLDRHVELAWFEPEPDRILLNIRLAGDGHRVTVPFSPGSNDALHVDFVQGRVNGSTTRRTGAHDLRRLTIDDLLHLAATGLPLTIKSLIARASWTAPQVTANKLTAPPIPRRG